MDTVPGESPREPEATIPPAPVVHDIATPTAAATAAASEGPSTITLENMQMVFSNLLSAHGEVMRHNIRSDLEQTITDTVEKVIEVKLKPYSEQQQAMLGQQNDILARLDILEKRSRTWMTLRALQGLPPQWLAPTALCTDRRTQLSCRLSAVKNARLSKLVLPLSRT